MQTLNHGWVDVLKMDVEGSEYHAFHYLSSLPGDAMRFTQLQLEVHQNMDAGYGSSGNANQLELLHTLLSHGFRTFSVEPNIYYSSGTCVEFSLMKFDRCGNVVTGSTH